MYSPSFGSCRRTMPASSVRLDGPEELVRDGFVRRYSSGRRRRWPNRFGGGEFLDDDLLADRRPRAHGRSRRSQGGLRAPAATCATTLACCTRSHDRLLIGRILENFPAAFSTLPSFDAAAETFPSSNRGPSAARSKTENAVNSHPTSCLRSEKTSGPVSRRTVRAADVVLDRLDDVVHLPVEGLLGQA